MAIRILSSENITGNLTLSGNQTTGGNAYVTGTSNSLVVISRDNMFVDAGQFYLGADDGTTDDSFRQRTASGSYFIESRKSGTWTNRLQINTAGTLIVQQGMAISGNIDGVGATFIGTAASGAALVTIENNSGSTATSYGLLVLGGGNSSNGRTFEVRDASGNTDLIVKGDGNVGIGTTSPSQKLEVVSAGFAYVRTRSTAGSFTGFDIGQHTGGSIFLNNRDNTAMVFMTNNTERMNILAGGTGTFYNAFSIQGDDKSLIVRNAAGTVIGSMCAESSSTPNVGMTTIRNNGTTTIQFNSNGSSYINGGNVGIGTTSPSNKLDVFAANNYEGIALTDSDETLWNILKSGSSVNTSYFNMFSEGVTKVRIHADNVSYFNGGNVGIGTTSPTLGKLQVAGSGYFGPVGTGNATTKAEMQSNAVLRLKPHDNNSTNMNFAQVNGGGGMGIQVTNGPGTANWDIALSPFGGNVGIGTTSPGNLLDVAGDTDITGQLVVSHDANYVAKFVNTATSMSNNNYALMVDSSAHTSNMSTAGAMSVDVDSGRAFTINGLGNVGIGTTSPQTKLEVNGGLIKVVDSGDTAFYGGDYVRVFGTQSYGFRNSAGSSIALISLNGNSYFNGGNVGIGITSPQDKLHVNGDAIISSTRHGDYATASLGTAGVAVAAISASTNGQSAIVEFVASGNNGAYYNVVYSCYNGGGYWYYTKNVVGSGGNIEVAETNGAGSSTLVFYFRTTSGTASYTPRVMMKGMPYNLVTF